MDFDPTSPIWLQVANLLKQDMVNGTLAPGTKLPSGRELAARYTINPNTAARVYQEMEAQGLCHTKRGLGTFVTEDSEMITALRHTMAKNAVDDFLSRMSRLGFTRSEAINVIQKEEL